MKAILCHDLDGPGALDLADVARPVAGPGEVAIDVRAVGLNFADTLMLRGKYQFRPPLPFSPGGEVAGRVSAVGEGVRGISIGQRVMAYVGWNGCREVAIARAEAVVPLPDEISDELAAGLTVTYGTAMHGLANRGELKPGETLAVLGAAGGAGLAGVEIGKCLGARVIAVASSAQKLEICAAHGADALIDYTSEDLRTALRQLGGESGIDLVYDCVGGAHAEMALRELAWGGRFLVIGFASGEIPSIALNLTLLKGCDIRGVFWSRFAEREPDLQRDNMRKVLDWCVSGRLRPRVGRVMPMAEAADALRLMENRQVTGKIILRL
jgi:NADPH2:quinone reductase